MSLSISHQPKFKLLPMTPKLLFSLLTKNAVKLYTEFGFLQLKALSLRQASFVVQFVIIVILKASLFPITYNPSIHNIANTISEFMVSPVIVLLLDVALLIPFILFILWTVLLAKQKHKYQFYSGVVTPANLKALTIRLMVVVEFALVPCLGISTRWFYLAATDPLNYFSIGTLMCTVPAFILACANILLEHEWKLLGKVTIPSILCCIGPKWNIVPVSLTALMLVLTRLNFKGHIGSSTNPIATTFKFLIVFTFALHALTPSISIPFFLFFVFIIAMIPIVSPEPEFIGNNIQVNKYLLKTLDCIKKEKTLKKRMEVKAIKEMLLYQSQQIKKHSHQTKDQPHPKKNEPHQKQSKNNIFKVQSPLSYENLCNFFRAKIAEDINQYKHETTYKLQYFLFEVKHSKFPLGVLEEIIEFSIQTNKNLEITPKVFLLEIQHEIEKIFRRKDENFSIHRLVDLCTKIEIANEYLELTINESIKFWKLLEDSQLSEEGVLSTISKIEKTEKHIIQLINLINFLGHYSSFSTQIKVYNYALELSNFSYEEQQKIRINSINDKSTMYLVIMSQYKVVDPSNQMLMQLRKNKNQVIGKSLETLIPSDLVNFINSRFMKAFDANQADKRVIPLLDISNRLVPFRVQLEMAFSLDSGVQQIIHFQKSDDVQELPIFLYYPSVDKIKFANKLFFSFIKSQGRKFDSESMGFDLFGSELFSFFLNKEVKVHDIFSCSFAKQEKNQVEELISLKILDIFEQGEFRCFMLSVESNEVIAELTSTTVFSAQNFINNKRKERVKNCRSSSMLNLADYQIQSSNVCSIPNPYESHIDESLQKINIDCRITKSNIAGLLIALFVLISVAGVIFVCACTSQLSSQIHDAFSLRESRFNMVESSYEMFYLSYRFYQIKNFSEPVLKIRNYNTSRLEEGYRKMISDRIALIVHLTSGISFAIDKKQYWMQHTFHNQTKTTKSISMTDFLVDIKYALSSNNPTFTIKNEHNLDTILSAYQQVNFGFIQDTIGAINYRMLTGFGLLLAIAIALKCIDFQIQKGSKQVIALYQSMPTQVIQEQTRRLKQLKAVLQYSASPSREQNQTRTDQIQEEWKADEKKLRIKTRTPINFLFSNNIIILTCFAFIFYIAWISISLESYHKNISMLLEKKVFLDEAILAVSKPAEKFYQAAMQQTLNPTERTPTLGVTVEKIGTDHINHSLPDFFSTYSHLEKSFLQSSLCKHAYLNQQVEYEGVNCSLVLSGAMTSVYSEALLQYKGLVRNYTGVGISKLGQTYRMGAVYPVYLQINYINKNLNLILTALKTELDNELPGFIDYQNSMVVGTVYNGVYVLSFAIIFLVLEVRRMRKVAKATIRAFKMMPKEYILKMKVTKYIKSQRILAKMEEL